MIEDFEINIPHVPGFDVEQTPLGCGTIGFVCRARNLRDGQYVAIKFLHKHLMSDHDCVQSFKKEADACIWLHHPNIVQVHYTGLSSDGCPFFVMEMLEGQTLATLLEEGKVLPEKIAIERITPVLSALSYAHANGCLHRNIKPGNIFLCHDGSTRVLDFGISKALKRQAMNFTGASTNSPDYMSPEQVQLAPVDVYSDLYSTGVVLYKMLTGVLPFVAQSPLAVIYMHVHNPPPPLPDAISHSTREVVMTALSKKPIERYATADVMLRALEPESHDFYYSLTNFEMGELIGSGVYGEVYEARHRLDGRTFAVKIARNELPENTDIRLLARADDACIKLRHPQIVRLVYAGVENGRSYAVMERLVGESLYQRLQREGALPETDAVRILQGVLDGLEQAHQKGLLHRDIKPGNIFLCDDGTERLLDFGTVKALGQYSSVADGTQEGTQEYMSPEQLNRSRGTVSVQSDIYSIGCVLYAILAGKPPFTDENQLAVAQMHQDTAPVLPDVSPQLQQILLRALAKNPARRFTTAAEMAATLTTQVNAGTRSPLVMTTSRTQTLFAPRVRNRRLPAVLGVIMGIGILLALGVLFMYGVEKGKARASARVPVHRNAAHSRNNSIRIATHRSGAGKTRLRKSEYGRASAHRSLTGKIRLANSGGAGTVSSNPHVRERASGNPGSAVTKHAITSAVADKRNDAGQYEPVHFGNGNDHTDPHGAGQ